MKPYQHFGLVRPPFEATPDPRVFYGAPAHGETLATLEYTVRANKACTVVVGVSGSGKTLLARLVAAQAGRRTSVLWVHGIGQPTDATEVSMFSPGSLSAPTPEPAVKQTTLAVWTRANHRAPEPPLLIIDDADELPERGWRDIVSLVSREVLFPRPVNMMLFGLPRLLNLLASPERTRLRRRVFRTCALGALNRRQVGEYIGCRLAAAGGRGAEIFSPEAIADVHRLTKGNPGLINQVCDNAMIEAFSNLREQITAADILAAVRAIVGAQNVLPPPDSGSTISLGRVAVCALPPVEATPPAFAPLRTVRARVTTPSEPDAPSERTEPAGATAPTRSAATAPASVAQSRHTVQAQEPTRTGRVSNLDTAGLERRLSYLETRLANALSAVRQARLRHGAATGVATARQRGKTTTPRADTPAAAPADHPEQTSASVARAPAEHAAANP